MRTAVLHGHFFSEIRRMRILIWRARAYLIFIFTNELILPTEKAEAGKEIKELFLL